MANNIQIVISAVDKATAGIKGVWKEIEGFAQRNNATFKKMAIGWGAAFASIKSFTIATANSFSEMQSNIAKSTGATWQQLKDFWSIAKEIWKTIPSSFWDIWSALWDVNTRFDITWKELQDVTKWFLNFARVNNTDVQSSIRWISRIMWDWWIETSKATDVLDKLTIMGQKTWVNIDTLSESVVTYWVQLRTLWFSMEESVAMLSKFEKEWVATTKVFSWLSIAMANLSEKWVKDIPQAFRDTIDNIKNAWTEAEATSIAMEMFGRRAWPDLAIAVREWRFELWEYMEMLKNTEWALEQVSKESMTFWERLILVKNNVQTSLSPVLDELIPKIEAVFEWITKWIWENQELTKNIILWWWAIAWIIAVLWTLWLAIIPIIASIKSMTIVVWLLGKALMFLALNPIWMVITAIAAWIAIWIAIVKNWETIKQKAIELWQWFKKLWEAIYAVFFNAWAKISQFVRNAKDWWKNMINMFVQGIKERYQKVKDWVLQIAQTIKNFLGFSSPTKEWPWSNSDRWIPNLINMMFDWFESWKSIIQRGAERIAETIQHYISDFDISFIEQKLQSIQVEAMWMSASLQSSLTSQKDSIKWLVDEYRNLEDQIKAIDMNIEGVQRSWEMEIANRVLEIQKELAQIEEKKAKNIENEKSSENELLQIKAEKLKAELEIAKANTDETNIIEAQRLAERSKTDIILERMQAKIQEHEEEKERITELMELKKEEIESEYEEYKKTVEQKKELDRAYFDLFQSKLQQQQQTIQETINMMRSLNSMSSWGGVTWARALWWPVQGGRSYLVGERWPELFTPWSSGLINPNPTGGATINLYMWGVVVQKEADENRYVEKIKMMLTREAKNFNIWIV